jgi:hypothetical protein
MQFVIKPVCGDIKVLFMAKMMDESDAAVQRASDFFTGKNVYDKKLKLVKFGNWFSGLRFLRARSKHARIEETKRVKAVSK